MPKIKKDRFGLYVNAGGWRSRPFYGTCFKEGDEVATHHFGGSTLAGVGLPGKTSFRRSRTNTSFEYWCTSGTMTHETGTEKDIANSIEWYWSHCRSGTDFFAERHNKAFASSVRRSYQDAYHHQDIINLTEIGKVCGRNHI